MLTTIYRLKNYPQISNPLKDSVASQYRCVKHYEIKGVVVVDVPAAIDQQHQQHL